ncbi:MAG: beta-propeller domain-containing protein [Planctomycetota bacterium]|jgi:hypothetical protein
MKKNIVFIIQMVIFLLPMVTTSYGTEQQKNPKQPVRHSYLCSDIGAKRVFKISAAGKIEWEYPADQCTDAWMLDNGNILMSFTGKTRGAREVTPDKKIAWEYTTDSEVWGCQRLGNGNTLVVECTAKRLIEVDRKGKIVKILPVKSGGNVHMGMRHGRKLANGNYLACFLDDKVVREYDSAGKIIRRIKVPDMAFSAIRLRNGNTVIGYRGGVIEVDPKDKVLWHLTQKDLPDVKLYWICCIQRLGNGNTVVGNWFIHKRRTDSTPFFEVTPDKEVVWRVDMHERMFDPASIQILDVKGYPLR